MRPRRWLLQFLSILLLVCCSQCCQKLEKQWLLEEMVKEYHVGPGMAANMYPHVLKDKKYSEVRQKIWNYLVILKKELLPKQREIDMAKMKADKERERSEDETVEKLKSEMRKYFWAHFIFGRYYPEEYVKFLQRKIRDHREINDRERKRRLEIERQRELDRIRESEDLP